MISASITEQAPNFDDQRLFAKKYRLCENMSVVILSPGSYQYSEKWNALYMIKYLFVLRWKYEFSVVDGYTFLVKSYVKIWWYTVVIRFW